MDEETTIEPHMPFVNAGGRRSTSSISIIAVATAQTRSTRRRAQLQVSEHGMAALPELEASLLSP